MQNVRKYRVISAIVILAALLTVKSAIAFGPRGFHGGGGHEFILEHIDDRVEDLDLNDEQMSQYQVLRAKVKANLETARAKRMELFEKVAVEMKKPNPDMEAVSTVVKQGFADLPDMMSANLDLFVEFYNILDEEQQEEILKKFRKKIDRMERYSGFGIGK